MNVNSPVTAEEHEVALRAAHYQRSVALLQEALLQETSNQLHALRAEDGGHLSPYAKNILDSILAPLPNPKDALQ